MYNQGLFHTWVPKIGMLLLIVLLLCVFMFINPINSGNIGLMVGSTGIMSEYFSWASFSATIGMGAGIPLVMNIKMRFRSKEIMITCLLVMASATIVIASTTSPVVLVLSCLIFGFFKIFGMVEIVLPIRAILSPTGDNGRFYSLFYPIVIGMGQLGGFVVANIAFSTHWQMVHFYSAAILLATAMLCVIVMHNQRFAPKVDLKNVNWWGLLLFIAPLMCFGYVFVFGKQQDWFKSVNIQMALAAFVLLSVLLVVTQLHSKHPYLKFNIFKLGSVRLGVFLLLGQGFFMAAGFVQSVYTSAILGYNWLINAKLGLYLLPGIILAGVVAFFWTKHKIPMKMYIFSAFAAYVAYYIILYFMMVPGLNIERFYLTQLLSGYGMCGLFISLWVFTFDKVSQADLMSNVPTVMVLRSFISIAMFSGILGWVQYQFQWQSVSNLAFYFDATAMNYDASIGNQGSIQLGAVLAANKTLLGYVIAIGIAFLIFIFYNHFGELKARLDYYEMVKGEYKHKKLEKREMPSVERTSENIGGIL